MYFIFDNIAVLTQPLTCLDFATVLTVSTFFFYFLRVGAGANFGDSISVPEISYRANMRRVGFFSTFWTSNSQFCLNLFSIDD